MNASGQCHLLPALGWPLWPGIAAEVPRKVLVIPPGLLPTHRQSDTAKDMGHLKGGQKMIINNNFLAVLLMRH